MKVIWDRKARWAGGFCSYCGGWYDRLSRVLYIEEIGWVHQLCAVKMRLKERGEAS